MPPVAVTSAQALTWRVRRNLLSPRGLPSAVDVARRLCGLHAQVLSAAGRAVAARRADATDSGLARAVSERELIRTWTVRGTLHLVAADDAGAFLSLVGAARTWEKPSWVKASGVTPDQMRLLGDVVRETLDGTELTREQLAAAVLARPGLGHLREQLMSGWSSVLKPLAWRGLLCQGLSAGGRTTFALPESWAPGWRGVPPPDEAARLVVPAFLSAYGPASTTAFDAWLTRGLSRKAALRGWFADLGDRLVTVSVDGEPAWLCAEHLDELRATEPSDEVHLLPAFDPYVLGSGTNDVRVVPAGRRGDVSRAAGWISPVVLRGGRVAGTWDVVRDDLEVRLFEDLPRAALDTAVSHMRTVLGLDT